MSRQVYAHRGASAELPENTIEAFARAVEVGADVLETDAHVTRDGVVVLSHDEHGRRMANVPRAIADCIARDIAPEPAGVEGLQDVRIVEAIYRSARDGRPVTLPRLARVETPPAEQELRKVADRRQAS